MKNNTTQQNIPNGWTSLKVGDIGSTYSGLRGKNKSDFGHGSPFITYMNIFSNSKIDKYRFDLVTVGVGENQNMVKYGDIFFTVSSETPEEVGMSSVLLDEIDSYYLNSFCFGFRLNNFNSLVPQYARYLFRGQDFRSKIIKMAQGSTRFNLSKERVLSLDIILPPTNEQQRIAKILGAVDEDIAKTQEVIEATEKLKRGLMQQLFTRGIGHTKFKETEIGNLPIEWKAVSLGKYVDIRSGDTPSGFNFEINAAIPFYKVEEMNNSSKYMISTRYFFNSYNKALMPKGMVVFPKRGASIYMNKVRILSSDSYFDTNVMGLITKNGLYSEYLYYLLIHIGLSQFADTTSVPQINNKHIDPLLVPLPANNEQKKIAEILSAVDEKISVNKKLKEKLSFLKKGLMQDLLSGRVRTS